MSVIHFIPLRCLCFAAFHAFWTSGMEFAACRRLVGGRDTSLQQNSFSFCRRIRNRNCRKQCLRIRMHRIAVNFLFFSDFHEITEIHNADTVTDVFHNAQVMCHKLRSFRPSRSADAGRIFPIFSITFCFSFSTIPI